MSPPVKPPTKPPAKPLVIVDCDPGHDDAVALLMAARHTELVGITTVSGNAPLSATTANALLVAQLGQLDVPVHSGAHRPLWVEPKHAAHAHGESGLDGPVRPPLERSVASTDAVRFIVDTVRTTDEVWLVPIGPLTNVAAALAEAPDIASRLAGISLMGGSTTQGNVTAAAEFNFWADPHAAAITLDSGVSPLLMCGLNLTHQFCYGETDIGALRAAGGTVCTFFAELFKFALDAYADQTGLGHSPLHDPCAVMVLTHPELFTFERRHVAVAVDDPLTAGMSLVDSRPKPAQEPNCEIATTIDAKAAMALVTETLGTFN